MADPFPRKTLKRDQHSKTAKSSCKKASKKLEICVCILLRKARVTAVFILERRTKK